MSELKKPVVKETKNEKSKSKRITGIVINVFLVLALIFGIFCSFTAFVSKNDNGVPNFLGISPFTIQSASMEPEFYKGDLIIDKRVTDPSTLKENDIITFWTIIEGERVLNSHRIIKITDNGSYLSFTTKGDNNTLEDSFPVHQSEIVGKYLFAVPKFGTFIDFLQTSTGFLVVIVVPVFLFFIYHLIQFFKILMAYQTEKMRSQLLEQMQPTAEGDDQDTAAAEAEQTPKTGE